MALKPSLMFGDVMHARLFPARNSFSYKIFYMVCSLDDLPSMSNGFLFGVNKPALMSFWTKDHGDRKKSNDPHHLKNWIHNVFKTNTVDYDENGKIVLVTMPRVLGYVFNPVSFWLCYNKNNELKSVLAEVNNTFGETHSYICELGVHEGNHDDWARAKKVFHVSPFLPRDGFYNFRYKIGQEDLTFHIDYYDASHQKQLVTILKGSLQDMDRPNLLKAFWGYPLITARAVYLIHWQAIKLWWKRQKFYKKPDQTMPKITLTYTKD